MRVKLALVAWLIFNFVASGKLLNRNTEVYHGLISEIQRYFINSNIVLFYPMENLGTDIVNFQGLLEIQKIIQSLFIPLGFQDEIFVWRLQNYLSKSNTFTAVMDFRSFNKTVCICKFLLYSIYLLEFWETIKKKIIRFTSECISISWRC